ncbi:MAG TPA: helix-turn-helix domain-containing protein [Candidatus Methylomirabilis sp.]|nr:helix-turn-helix domain-containing protein [Candidatus Methylomirabilis sp.]
MSRQQVLLVEDDRAIRDVVTLFFGDRYDVRQAATGAEAISIVQRESLGAVVLDYRLPDQSGLDVLTEIRSSRPRLPVVMMTGYGSEWLCASALKLGVRDYFPKPVHLADLLDSVRRILSEGSPPGEADAGDDEEDDSLRLAARGLAGVVDLSIQKAVRLIQLRYWDNLSLSGLARELGMSKYHLSRRFKEVMGVTFRSFLLQTRIERAKVLLGSRQSSITEVAHSVGFGDLPRFDKLFKRYTGLTPSAYRAAPPSDPDDL